MSSGDRVVAKTLDVSWGLEPPTDETSPRAKLDRPDEPRYRGPALVGPVAVEGAEPGTVLEVRIMEVVPAPWGWTWSGGAGELRPAINRGLGIADEPAGLTRWSLDPDAGTATTDDGRRVTLRPFPGVLGLAPAEAGWHSGWVAGPTGGNLDCPELVAGSTLFLPVEVSGGLLSVGDGHAAQGEGEIGGMAVECPLERIVLELGVRRDMEASRPLARTPDAWVALGSGQTLEEAALDATDGILDLLERELGVRRRRAVALASAVVNLRVTQMVNETVGVHARLSHRALEGLRGGC